MNCFQKLNESKFASIAIYLLWDVDVPYLIFQSSIYQTIKAEVLYSNNFLSLVNLLNYISDFVRTSSSTDDEMTG